MLNVIPSVPLWKQILRKNFVNINKLIDFLELTIVQREKLHLNPRFILNLPYRLAEKIEKGNDSDPIFRQFVPTIHEQVTSRDFVLDPVNDHLCRSERKLLHKYHGRALLVCSSACAMHCRYCFRQNFDYETKKGFESEIALIREDNSINEVILSGGDPLSLDDSILDGLIQDLAQIPHVKKLRFHTRFPIGIPERIDASFLNILKNCPMQIWFVVHTNHPRELDSDVLKSLKSIQLLGIPVMNQFVLLKGVNDDVQVLIDLCTTLVDHGVFLYYLHQLDQVAGAEHFAVSKERGVALIDALRNQLPGYAIPKYVADLGGPSKSALY